MITTKNVDLSDMHLDVTKGKRALGKDCAPFLLGIIPFGIPNFQDAVDDTLKNGNGNIMVDEVTYVSYFDAIIVTVNCVEVEGTVLQTALKR